MLRQKVIINSVEGFHTRPAALFVTESSRYKSEVFIEYNSIRVNGKSILGLLMLGLSQGNEVMLEVNGKDEKLAISNLAKFLSN